MVVHCSDSDDGDGGVHTARVYTGAIGMFGPGRSMHLSIAIRGLHHEGGRYSFQVGGAIVADSDAEAEYMETLVKARGMAQALGMKWNTSL